MALTVASVDLKAIQSNVRALRTRLRPGTRMMAVVKADAYGHGSVPVARALSRSGLWGFGVATMEEALELRESGVHSPIVLLYSLLPEPRSLKKIVQAGLEISVCNLALARGLDQEARKLRRRVPVHLKVDTGMGRLGILPEEVPALAQEISRLPGLYLKGIFSHLPLTASLTRCHKAFTLRQVRTFMDLVHVLKRQGLHVPFAHISNSAAVIEIPSAHFDLVRPGLALYGLYPRSRERSMVALCPALSFKTKVIYLKRVSRGTGISYGHTWRAPRPSIIATLAAGYADGYRRLLSNHAEVLIHGRRTRVVGTVCMDTMMTDVTHVPGVRIGDEAVLIGRQGSEEISADEIAAKLKTITYEVTSLICKRVMRVYPGE